MSYFFFLMIRRPPTSTLFPSRRSSDLGRADRLEVSVEVSREGVAEGELDAPAARQPQAPRSEEHTSELQSQSNLVCRLLPEKKKTYRCRQRRGAATTTDKTTHNRKPWT